MYEAFEAGKKGDFSSAVVMIKKYLDFFQYSIQERLIYQIAQDAQDNILTKGNARHLFRVISKAYHEGIQNSIEGYRNSVNDNPDYMPVYIFRGYWYEMYDYQDEALSDYNRAIELEPENFMGYFYRGRFEKRQRNLEKAVFDLIKSLQLHSLFIPAYVQSVQCYIEMEQFGKAIETYEKAVKLDPACKKLFWAIQNAYRGRGIIRLNNSDYKLALADFNAILDIDPGENWDALTYRGMTYRKLKRYDEAMADLSRAISIYNKYSKAYLERGLTYAALGFYHRAIADYDRAAKEYPEYMQAYYHRAEAYAQLGEVERALTDYNQAIILEPDYCWTYYRKAIVCENAQKRRAAIDAYLSFLERVPEKYSAQISLARKRLWKLQN
jgi:tetratricopeptide (TPR) repeat protein